MTEQKPVAFLLRQLREKQGTSLRAVAAEIGIAPSHLSRLERGHKRGSAELVRRVANYYGADPAELLEPDLPADVVQILRDHPEAIDELRRRYGD